MSGFYAFKKDYHFLQHFERREQIGNPSYSIEWQVKTIWKGLCNHTDNWVAIIKQTPAIKYNLLEIIRVK